MIDVMMILVLFLAVMAFLPQVQNTIQTDLPGAEDIEDEVTKDDIMVTLESDGTFVNEVSVSNNELISRIRQEMGGNEKRRVVIAADKNLPYEQVVALLARLQKENLRNVALATEKAQ